MWRIIDCRVDINRNITNMRVHGPWNNSIRPANDFWHQATKQCSQTLISYNFTVHLRSQVTDWATTEEKSLSSAHPLNPFEAL